MDKNWKTTMSNSRKNTPPLKPTALINFKKTDGELARIIGSFWKLTWNQGAGHFASEIGPSPLFAAYQLIKKLEAEQVARPSVLKQLTERFGEKNSAVGTGFQPPQS